MSPQCHSLETKTVVKVWSYDLFTFSTTDRHVKKKNSVRGVSIYLKPVGVTVSAAHAVVRADSVAPADSAVRANSVVRGDSVVRAPILSRSSYNIDFLTLQIAGHEAQVIQASTIAVPSQGIYGYRLATFQYVLCFYSHSSNISAIVMRIGYSPVPHFTWGPQLYVSCSEFRCVLVGIHRGSVQHTYQRHLRHGACCFGGYWYRSHAICLYTAVNYVQVQDIKERVSTV